MAKDNSKPDYVIYNVFFFQVAGAENTYAAHWDINTPADPTKCDLASVDFQWYYTIKGTDGGNYTMIGPSGSIDYTSVMDTRVWTAEYTPPENASKIRIALRPISKTKTENGKETAILGTLKREVFPVDSDGRASWFTLLKAPKVEDNFFCANIHVEQQNQNERTLVATWDPDMTQKRTTPSARNEADASVDAFLYAHVDSYEYEWRYRIDGNWFIGTTGTVEVENPKSPNAQANPPRNSVYTAPDGADRVRFRVRGIPLVDKKMERESMGTTIVYYIPWFRYTIWSPVSEDSKGQKVSGWREFVMPKAIQPRTEVGVGTITITSVAVEERSVYATWTRPSGYIYFDDYTDGFTCEWQYKSQGQWFEGSTEDIDIVDVVDDKWTSSYSYGVGVTNVRVRVTPVPKTFTEYGEEVTRYIANVSGWVYHTAEPETPSAPTFTADANNPLRLTAQVDTYDARTKQVDFQFVINNKTQAGDPHRKPVTVARATETIMGEEGKTYKVRARGVFVSGNTVVVGDWSEYSADIMIPAGAADPDVPTVPTVTINGYNLEMSVDCYDTKAKSIQFYVVKNDENKCYNYSSANVAMNRASCSIRVAAGNTYKVKCRAMDHKITSQSQEITKSLGWEISAWSEYSADAGTRPNSVVDSSIAVKATSETSVSVSWAAVVTAESYTIEYTTNPDYFDAAPGQVQSVDITSGTTAIITGMESGNRYYFRIKATNQYGSSEWSAINNCVLGGTPNAPTTWSSSSTAAVGDQVLLYWIHNSEDGSAETYARLAYRVVPASNWERIVIPNDEEALANANIPSIYAAEGRRYYVFDTSSYQNGAKIEWYVRTQGVLTGSEDYWSPKSETRKLEVYAPPTLDMTIQYSKTWYWDGATEGDTTPSTITDWLDLGDSYTRYFPIRIVLEAGPSSQTPVSYSISIVSTQTYEDLDQYGRTITVMKGTEIYSKYMASSSRTKYDVIGHGNANFQNGVLYKIKATVAMNSGLTAETETTFGYRIDDDLDFGLNAAISYDSEYAVAYIRPYSMDSDGNLEPDIIMSLYRREFDGTFTLLASDLDNFTLTTVTDPHPSLDYARYRVVGTSHISGVTNYVDLAPYHIGETSIIIQWDEEWTNFSNTDEDVLYESKWGGSMLRLPWNVDVSDSNTVDVEMVEYIGRRHPVSYYGTQVGQTASWKTEIPTYDTETLYGLRRLATYLGNVYVREPSGTGYWAQVKVQLSRNHNTVTIPVTLDITRVEGEM